MSADITISRQYVSFGHGEELFGVEVTRAREILDLPQLAERAEQNEQTAYH